VRLITRGGNNWTDGYPWIVDTARKVPQKNFVLDGEAVVLGVDGIADFNALHTASTITRCSSVHFDILVEGWLKGVMTCVSVTRSIRRAHSGPNG